MTAQHTKFRLPWTRREDGLWNATCPCGATIAGVEMNLRVAAERWHADKDAQEIVRLNARLTKEAEAAENVRLALWQERDEARAEVTRSRAALDAIHEVAFDALAHEDHVEHIIKDHGPEGTRDHYRCLAQQMLTIQAACGLFFDPIVEQMEARAEAAIADAIAYCATYDRSEGLPRCGAPADEAQFGQHRFGSPWKCSREPDHESPHVAIDNDGKTVRAQWSAFGSDAACTCGEINARHCPVHNEVGGE